MVIDKIRDIIADALYVDLDEVQRDTNLVKELGAESIDFLDIVFRLEKEFDVKIPRGDIQKKAQGALSDDEFAVNGLITEEGLVQLRNAMPEVDDADIKSGLFVRDIPGLFKVATFERMVIERMSSVEEPAMRRSGAVSPGIAVTSN